MGADLAPPPATEARIVALLAMEPRMAAPLALEEDTAALLAGMGAMGEGMARILDPGR